MLLFILNQERPQRQLKHFRMLGSKEQWTWSAYLESLKCGLALVLESGCSSLLIEKMYLPQSVRGTTSIRGADHLTHRQDEREGG